LGAVLLDSALHQVAIDPCEWDLVAQLGGSRLEDGREEVVLRGREILARAVVVAVRLRARLVEEDEQDRLRLDPLLEGVVVQVEQTAGEWQQAQQAQPTQWQSSTQRWSPRQLQSARQRRALHGGAVLAGGAVDAT